MACKEAEKSLPGNSIEEKFLVKGIMKSYERKLKRNCNTTKIPSPCPEEKQTSLITPRRNE